MTAFLPIQDQKEWLSSEECPAKVVNKSAVEQQKLYVLQENEDLHGLFKIK